MTVEATELSVAFSGGAFRASSGNCSTTLGLAANARFLVTSAKAAFEFDGLVGITAAAVLRVSQGNISLARGLAAKARLFNDSTESIGCPNTVGMCMDHAATMIASKVSLFCVFIFRLSLLFLVCCSRMSRVHPLIRAPVSFP
jgi:hypothetical protein